MVRIREKERNYISKTFRALVVILSVYLNISVALKYHYLESFYVNLA